MVLTPVEQSGPLVFAGWQTARPCFKHARARARMQPFILYGIFSQTLAQPDFVAHFVVATSCFKTDC